MKKQTIKNLLQLVAITLLWSATLTAQKADLTGKWNGAIKIPGMPLNITLDFEKEGKQWKGDLDIPVQRIVDMELAALKIKGAAISFKLPEVPGNATFEGTIQRPLQEITGTFTQGGASFPLTVKRESAEEKAKWTAKIDRIKALADSAILKAKVPGLGFGIIKDGEVLMAEGFGYKDQEDKKPVTPNTQFAIGSSSKAFTTMGLALLEDEGLLDWETPVQQYIPAFEMSDDFASREMTAVDLVCHRSGLPRHDFLWYGSSLSREELLTRIKYLEPSAPFRTKFQYQNLMFMTAGVVTERLSGQTWENYIHQKVFQPLSMSNSNFSVEDMQQSADFALPYRKTEEEQVEKIPYRNIDAIGPAGSINSSVNDMLKWVQLHLNDGKAGDQRIVSAANLKKMHSPHKIVESFKVTNFPQFNNPSYGLGWFIYDYDGSLVVQHGGNIDGFSALVYLLPKENIGMVLLTNLNGNGVPALLANYATDILLEKDEVDWFRMIYGDKEEEEQEKEEEAEEKENKAKRVEGTSPSHGLKDYVGDYQHKGYGTISVNLKNNLLHFQYNSFDLPMTHWHYDVFKGKDEQLDLELPLQFQMDMEASITSLEIPIEPTLDPIRFVKQAPSQLTDPDFLAKLAGDYDADGLLIKVQLEGKKLVMSPTGQGSIELIPYKDTSFKPKGLNGFVFDFKMNKDQCEEIILNQPNGVFVATRK